MCSFYLVQTMGCSGLSFGDQEFETTPAAAAVGVVAIATRINRAVVVVIRLTHDIALVRFSSDVARAPCLTFWYSFFS